MRSNIFLVKEKTELISPWAYKNWLQHLGHLKVGVVSHVSKTKKVQKLTLAAITCNPEERTPLPIDFKKSEDHFSLEMMAFIYLSLVPLELPYIYFPLLSSCLPGNLLIIICFPMQICLQEENSCSALSKCVVNKLVFYVLSMWSLLWVHFSFWAFKAESQTQGGFPSSCDLLRDSKGFFFPQYHSALATYPKPTAMTQHHLCGSYYELSTTLNICTYALKSPS